MADGIAVRDAMNLPQDPTLWTPPARDPAQARLYRDRIIVGFTKYQQNLNRLKEWLPYRNPDVGDEEVLEKIWNPPPILDEKQLEALMVARVSAWNRDYEKRQAVKSRELRTTPSASSGQKSLSKPPVASSPVVPVRVPATGAWVLEKTEFVVEKVDAAFMQKSQPTETGGDGAGSAGSTFGNPAHTWRMKITWTPPPKMLVPGEEINFTVTVSDAGSDDPNASGFGSVGANCPSLSAVWYGPAAGFNLKLGERSKVASKAYTPLKAAPGAVMVIAADYGVFSRRQQFVYTYRFTLDAGNVAAPVSTASAPPAVAPVEVSVFDSMNIYGVANQPTAPATYTIRQPQVITSIMTYHWNNGRGTHTGTIALREANGRMYGPWPVSGAPGQGGVPNASWTCNPKVEIPAGTYTIVDSEPATWSQNPQSGGRGMAVVKGYPIN